MKNASVGHMITASVVFHLCLSCFQILTHVISELVMQKKPEQKVVKDSLQGTILKLGGSFVAFVMKVPLDVQFLSYSRRK